MNKAAKVTLTIAVVCVLSTGARASLLGDLVDLSFLYPNTSTVYYAGGTALVDGTVEYPVASYFFSAQITGDQVILQATSGQNFTQFNSAAFDGVAISVVSGSTFTGVSQDPSSTLLAYDTWIAGNTLYLNFQSQPFPTGSRSVFDVESTPEPLPIAVLGLGAAGLLFHRRRA